MEDGAESQAKEGAGSRWREEEGAEQCEGIETGDHDQKRNEGHTRLVSSVCFRDYETHLRPDTHHSPLMDQTSPDL